MAVYVRFADRTDDVYDDAIFMEVADGGYLLLRDIAKLVAAFAPGKWVSARYLPERDQLLVEPVIVPKAA